MHNVSLKYTAVKKFNLKNPGRAAAILNIEKKQYFTMMQNGSLQGIIGQPSWVFATEMFNSRALQRHVLRHRAKFCRDRSYCFRDVAKFLRNAFF